MTDPFRSGNSRSLAKIFDQLGHPLVVLDRRGVIAFVNQTLVQLVKADATELVGQQSSWQLTEDANRFASLLTALAPPASALEGKLVARQLTTPIVFGSTHTGQLFIPLLDDEGTPHATLVVLGEWSELTQQMPSLEPSSQVRKQSLASALVSIRSRWQTLDHLHALIGSSAASELAMARTQLAIGQPSACMLSGPPGSGKRDIARGIFMGRLRQAGVAKLSGQLLPIDCRVLTPELFAETLEGLAGRISSEASPLSQQLLLENLEYLNESSIERLSDWLERHARRALPVACSTLRSDELSSRSVAWSRLVAGLATIEIVIPPLRERPQDVVPLALHLLAANCQKKQRAQLTLSPEVQQLFCAFPWPQNCHQLSQAIDTAVDHAVLVSSIQVSHLPVAIRSFASSTAAAETVAVQPIDLDQVLLQLERVVLARALKLSPRNRAQAARWLGISRPRLLRRIEQLGLEDEGGQASE